MNKTKNTLLAAAFILVAAGAQAAHTPAEINREITRGNGAADLSMMQLDLVPVQTSAKTAFDLNRQTPTASSREAVRAVSEGQAVQVHSEKRPSMPTASQINHHS